jgi:hypothetical protein
LFPFDRICINGNGLRLCSWIFARISNFFSLDLLNF